MNSLGRLSASVLKLVVAIGAVGAERTETFDLDPRWDAHNCRAVAAGREVRQDFGFSGMTAHCAAKGEIGGFIQPAAEPAYYAKIISPRTLDDTLAASGKLVYEGRQGNALIGFFNAAALNEWRTPNTIALRVYGRGQVFYAYVEYATQKWRAGAGEFRTVDPTTRKSSTKQFKSGTKVHSWALRYSPAANGGNGSITGQLDGEELIVNLEPGHKADGAAFNRFGLLNVMKHYDGGGELWLDELVVNGESHRFDEDPHWEGLNNRRSYTTFDVRPWFDFGFSPTQFACGKGSGELGGLIFRGDGRRFRQRHADRVFPFGAQSRQRRVRRVQCAARLPWSPNWRAKPGRFLFRARLPHPRPARKDPGRRAIHLPQWRHAHLGVRVQPWRRKWTRTNHREAGQ
ncbi:MAG: hypothetical protein DME22_10275 [Verrucomicrobia bacterium]|nr:MAG: hypothetical protein DME22_10275 [Verrucomicrobiota bacterium]